MGMGFAPTWLHQVTPLLHKTTLTTAAIKTGTEFSENKRTLEEHSLGCISFDDD